MNVEIETEAAQFPETEYINGIFVAVWLGATSTTTPKRGSPLLFCSLHVLMSSPHWLDCRKIRDTGLRDQRSVLSTG